MNLAVKSFVERWLTATEGSMFHRPEILYTRPHQIKLTRLSQTSHLSGTTDSCIIIRTHHGTSSHQAFYCVYAL